MIKALILLLNLLGIFLSGLFFPDPVTVSQTVPASAQLNNSILVQVTINKGALNGSGKFAEQLPAGFRAVPIDDEGAQTSFDSNTIAFVWNSLPSGNTLEVSFRVDITSAATVRNYTLTGRFLYTANSQSSEVDCPPSDLTVTGGPVAQASSTPQNNAPQTSTPPAVSQNNVTTQNSITPTTNNTPQTNPIPQNSNQSTGGVFVVRQFSSASITPGNDATVTLTVHKAHVIGFAKIEDSIPPGFTANGVELRGASFTFIDSRAKFVWGDLPADSVISISYRLSSVSGSPGTHIVVGNFSYLYNNNPLTTSISSSIFNSSAITANNFASEKTNVAPPATTNTNITPAATSTANNTISANTQPGTTNTNVTPTEPTVISSSVNNTPVTNASVTPTQPAVSDVPVTPGLTYKVQIMALHNSINLSYFKNRKVKEHINTETDGGLTKYTIGNFTDYKLVKDARDNLRSRGFDGAFIVTYKSGMRLSLEDAMKISH